MSTEERIKELTAAIAVADKHGLPCDDEVAELRKLKTQGAAAGSAVEVPATETGVEFEDIISQPKKFAESAKYQLMAEGNFYSKIVRYVDPSTEKPQRWFIVETEDEKLTEPNRGVLVGEFGAGSGIYRGILDDLGIKYTFDEATNKLKYRLHLPLYFWADWSSDDRAIGSVKISQITIEKPTQVL